MGFQLKQLWSAPEINPYNKKAKSIPVFNPVNKYGRVFFFSYLGFFIAFWSWYAFPPLVSHLSSRRACCIPDHPRSSVSPSRKISTSPQRKSQTPTSSR
jgi:hypothetical protein